MLRLMSGEAATIVVQVALAEGAPERLSEGVLYARHSESPRRHGKLATAKPTYRPESSLNRTRGCKSRN